MKKLAIALVFLLALAGCGTGADAVNQQAGGDKRFVSGDGSVSNYSYGERSTAPNISGDLVDGGEFKLDKFAGKIVVINFWGQWCAPCRAEADDLIEVHEATKADGVEFLGINVRDSKDRAKAFEKNFDVPYPSIFDPAGRVALGFRDTPPNAIPATIVLDREHRVATVFRKPLLAEDLEPVVRALIAEN